jgi:hypothetical protein
MKNVILTAGVLGFFGGFFMKMYSYVLCAISLAGSFGIVKSSPNFGEMADQSLYHSSTTARVFSRILLYDKDARARYVKHAEFYAKKNNRSFVQDNLLDHVVYHGVDMAVGVGMHKASTFECVSEVAENLSADNKKFIAENTRLIITASVIKGVTIQCDKGIENISKADCKRFAKSVTAQVSSDAISNYVIKPLVNGVAEKDSWTEWGLQSTGDIVATIAVVILVDHIAGR